MNALRRWWLRHFGAFEVRDEQTGERTIYRWSDRETQWVIGRWLRDNEGR